MLKSIKEFFKNHNSKKLLSFGLISSVLVLLTFYNFVEFSSFAVVLAKSFLGIGLIWWVDEYMLKTIETIEELKKGNIAYALFLLGMSVIIAAAVIGS